MTTPHKPPKIKTSLRLADPLVQSAQEIGREIGLGKGDMLSLGLAFALIHLAPTCRSGRKRRQILDIVEEEVQTLLGQARERLTGTGDAGGRR